MYESNCIVPRQHKLDRWRCIVKVMFLAYRETERIEDEAKAIIENSTGKALTGRTVSVKINSPKNDGRELLDSV